MKDATNGRMTVVLMSRCSWTLYNFRRGLISRLVGMGLDVVACGAGGDGFELRLRNLGCRFQHIPLDKGGMNPFADFRTLIAIVRLLRREQPAVVHAFTIKPVIYGSIAARFTGVPVRIATITGLGYAFAAPGGWVRRTAVMLYRLSMHCVHRVFFQNLSDRDLFVAEVLPNGTQYEVVPGSGVNLEEFKPRERDSGVVPQVPKVLMFCRMLWDKGVGDFVEAARLLRLGRRMNVRFVLLGDPDPANPQSVPLAQLHAWAAEGIVEYYPAVADIRDHVADADIVVLPSRHEGLPRSLLEAAAMGKPLIASDIPGCRPVIESGKNGFLVPVGDVPKLADAIARALDDAQWLIEAGQSSRKLVEERFSESVVIDRALAAYGLA